MPPLTPDDAPELAASRQAGPAVAAARQVASRDSAGFDFVSSVIAGLLIGFSVDWLAGTRPWFIVAGIAAGCVSGFIKLWAASKVLEEQAAERMERRRG